MAVSQIEEKILGRLAKETESSNPLLSASLYQVLGLSILLSRRLFRARKLRRLDITRDTKSLQLYHHIIWLAREALSITEVYILPYCQDGEQGPECRVMAVKLRASLYHIFCLFHNHPPLSRLKSGSPGSGSSPSSNGSPKGSGKPRRTASKSQSTSKEGNGHRRQRSSKSALRDPIPSVVSDASYVTNPYASPASPPPVGPIPPLPEARKTPTRPPGLAIVKIPSPQAAASFLLPPLNFVPMTREHFESTQQLANKLLPSAHALRLSVSLEYSAFLWDCEKEHEQARKLARRTIKDVYSSTQGLDDEEFADAAAMVQALGGIVRRGSAESSPKANESRPVPPPKPPPEQLSEQQTRPTPGPSRTSQPRSGIPLIDRTIAVSPASAKRRIASPPSTSPPSQIPRSTTSRTRTPDRLSTVPEDPSQETSERDTTAPTTLSRLSSRSNPSKPRRASSSTSNNSDKAAKRRAVEAAEELYRRNSGASRNAHSRQTTPVETYVRQHPPVSASPSSPPVRQRIR